MRLQLLLSILPAVFAIPPVKRDEPAPLLVSRDAHALVANKYIVKMKDATTASALESTISILSKEPDNVYGSIFRGFSATLDQATLKAIRSQPDVDYVEQDSKVSINAAAPFIKQKGATWGLGRISHKKPGSTEYVYNSTAGAGTCAYVIDTGIEDTHVQFQGRALQITSFVDGQYTDGNGHGTHVAGTIGGVTYGVAKKTRIYGVKVLDDYGSGSFANVIAGMDYVVQDAGYRKSSCPKGVVVNISIGGYKSTAVNAAAASMVKNNIFVAVAAGNDNDDAKYYSPASEPLVCTVGAITKGDTRAYYSNYGAAIDVFAPGTGVKSAWIGGTVKTIDGTSMATPHITGLAAYFASLSGFPGAQTLCNRIKTLATPRIITGVPAGTPNQLAFNKNPSG